MIDWRTREIDKKPVRVVIFDDPDFLPLLADADREFLLQIFAYMLVDMIRSGLPRFQYGLSVSVLDEGAISVPMYVEYHATVIKSDLPPDVALQPRYLAKIWRGPPPSKVRRLFSRIR
ncbi:MAG: hypothetical protein FJ276_23175 [Planctomycetes bacterium]|nr:hypothetical protein [Planctomycetota bacterium]